MTYEEMVEVLKIYHVAACRVSHYNAGEGIRYHEETEAREEAIKELNKARDVLEVARIPCPIGYLQ